MIYILIPVYNEEGNIDNLYRELIGSLPGEQKFIVFSDDGSTDDSVAMLKERFSALPHIVLGDGTNNGPGAAFNKGFEWILQNAQAEDCSVVTMEADCTSDLSILPHMVGINRMGYSLVLASVYAQGGGFDETSFFRRLISSIANLLYRFLFKLNILTLSSFYRVYSLSLLKDIRKRYGVIITERGFICMLEVLIKAIVCRCRVIEVPMLLQSHKRVGKSKMKIFRTSLQYFRFLITFRR
jgi:dolichol-phosphate mannosyltransferase